MAGYSRDFWKTMFSYPEIWRKLSVDQRMAAMELEAGYHEPDPAWESLPAPLADSLFEKDAKGRFRAHSEFRRWIGFLHRLADWSVGGGVDLTIHIQQLMTLVQRQALTGLDYRSSTEVTMAALAGRMEEGWFAKVLLDSESSRAFLAKVSDWRTEGLDFTEARFAALRKWIGIASDPGADTLPLDPKRLRIPDADLSPDETIHLLLNYGLAVVALDLDSLLPMIKILIPVATVVQNPENVTLQKMTGGDSFSRPFLLDDMDVYLRSIKAEPAPLLSDGNAVPVAHHRKVAKLFLALPPPLPSVGFDGEDRAKAAWWAIARFGLFEVSGRGRKTWKAEMNPEGEAWLAMPRERKLDRLLARLPCGRRGKYPAHERFSWLGDYDSLPMPYSALRDRVFEWMDAAVARLDSTADFGAWIGSAASLGNPFLADAERSPDANGRWRRWSASPQHTYAILLMHYVGRLCSLGAVALAADRQGNLGVSLTPVGRYLCGLSDNWQMPIETIRSMAMVGADFTIVLLEPAPVLALELSAFADKEGADAGPETGTVFRLTRRSVQEGVHRGLSAEDMLCVLRACAKKGVPANVAYEIKDWAESKQSVRISEAILLEGKDPIHMAEILSRFPKDFERVAPTVLKYLGDGKRGALVKRLMKKGFFTE